MRAGDARVGATGHGRVSHGGCGRAVGLVAAAAAQGGRPPAQVVGGVALRSESLARLAQLGGGPVGADFARSRGAGQRPRATLPILDPIARPGRVRSESLEQSIVPAPPP